MLPFPTPTEPSPSGPPAHLSVFLDLSGTPYECISPGAPMPTIVAAAEAINVHPSQILKTLVCDTSRGVIGVVVASGEAHIDLRKLAPIVSLDPLHRPPSTG